MCPFMEQARQGQRLRKKAEIEEETETPSERDDRDVMEHATGADIWRERRGGHRHW
jgi:hypothetical protein